MRIGIDIGKAIGHRDGIGRYTAGLLRGLAAAAAEVSGDWEYRLYPLFETSTEAELGAALAPLELGERFVVSGERAPASGEVDLFHCTTHSVPAAYRGPLVFTLYDLTFVHHAAQHTLDNRLHCLTGVARALSRGAKWVAISEATRADAAQVLGLPAAEIDVVAPAVDELFGPRTETQVAAVCARHGLAPGYVLHVGTLEPRKNLPRLLDAHRALDAELRARHPLVVVGGGGWGETAAALTRAAESDHHVVGLGEIADAELPELYAGASVLAYPSLYEGFGLPPLEAMACGTPALVSNVSSLPEAVGDAALLVDPESSSAIRDGLERLLRSPELRADLAHRGELRAASSRWLDSGRAQHEVYRRALEARWR